MIAIAALVVVGWMPALAIFGVLHLLVVVALMGKKMAARYDLQEAWRQRYKMDDFGVARLRKTVTRSAASLPSLILWALAPKEEGMAAVAALAALGPGAWLACAASSACGAGACWRSAARPALRGGRRRSRPGLRAVALRRELATCGAAVASVVRPGRARTLALRLPGRGGRCRSRARSVRYLRRGGASAPAFAGAAATLRQRTSAGRLSASALRRPRRRPRRPWRS